MRTVTQIKNEMTAAFMAHTAIKQKYDPNNTWTSTTTFDDVFATTSVESILFYIVAVISYGLEYLFYAHKSEVEAMEEMMRVGGKEWWRQQCLNFQYGDNLAYNSITNVYEYTTIDETAKIIKYVDIKETGNGLVIRVNKADLNGDPETLDSNERTAFDVYLKKIKIAGIRTSWNSYNPDRLTITLNVKYNPLILDYQGKLITTGINPVELAIRKYLLNIPFGSGKLNKTQLIDAIQAAEGVVDPYPVDESWLKVKTDYNPTLTPIYSQDLLSWGGSFVAESLLIIYIADV